MLIVCAFYVKAQSPDKKFSFMIKGGINLANYQLTEPKIFLINNDFQFKNLIDFNLIALANAKIAQPFFLQFGLGLSQKGSKIKFNVNFRDEYNNYIGIGEENFIYRITYLELPLNLIYSYKKLLLGGGSYLAYAIAAKSIYTPSNLWSFYQLNSNSAHKSDLPIGNDNNSIIKPLDFGFNFLADYKLNYGLSIGVNYGLGITKASKLPPVREGRNRVFSVLVGYSF